MKCFYYKWVNKKTKKVILANFEWAETFEEIKTTNETSRISCVEISKDEFRQLRKENY